MENDNGDPLSSFEMFVANENMGDDMLGGRRLVPPPRFSNSSGASDRYGYSNGSTLARSESAQETRALKQELGQASADLQMRNRELAQVQVALRMKDRELKLVKEQLAQSKIEARELKSELRDVYSRMQAKDTELLAAYEQLMESARERARLRDQLILAEQELQQTRMELQSWRQGLLEVKSLMESVDEVSSESGQEVEELWADLEEGAIQGQMEEGGRGTIFSGALSFMRNLTEMSRQLVKDAAQDEAVYSNPYNQVEKKTRGAGR